MNTMDISLDTYLHLGSADSANKKEEIQGFFGTKTDASIENYVAWNFNYGLDEN